MVEASCIYTLPLLVVTTCAYGIKINEPNSGAVLLSSTYVGGGVSECVCGCLCVRRRPISLFDVAFGVNIETVPLRMVFSSTINPMNALVFAKKGRLGRMHVYFVWIIGTCAVCQPSDIHVSRLSLPKRSERFLLSATTTTQLNCCCKGRLVRQNKCFVFFSSLARTTCVIFLSVDIHLIGYFQEVGMISPVETTATASYADPPEMHAGKSSRYDR